MTEIYALTPSALPATLVNAGDYGLVTRDTTDDRIVDMFLHSGKRANSPRTQDTYTRIIAAFREYTGRPLQACTLDVLQDWRESLHTRTDKRGALVAVSENTQRLHMATIRSLFAFCVRVGYLRMSPAVMLEVPPVLQTVHRRALSIVDTSRMLEACQTAQETALLRVLYSSGARVSEILDLTWQDVTPREKDGKRAGAVLHIVSGKGGKSRKAGIKEDTYTALVAMRTPATQETDYVFRTRTGNALDRQAAHHIIKRIATRAGVKIQEDTQDDKSSDVSCHWLRHTHATHYVANGGDISALREQLGHASLNTTTIYAESTSYSSDKLPL